MTTAAIISPSKKTMTRASHHVASLVGSKVDLGQLKQPGDYLSLHDKLCRDLAKAYQEQEERGSSWCVSWPNQVKAQNYFNEHGFVETLKHMNELLNALGISQSDL